MTMRNQGPSNTPTSWIGHKDKAKIHFRREEYDAALQSYRAALSPEYGCPAAERQIILSNIVACRLKIGGPAMASAAVEDAKQCVALNPQWAKGHFRLACAYAALGDRSNDVCQSLQRTLSLDPGNASARQMLLRELRGRGRPRPSAPPADQDPSRETRPDDIPSADTIDETIPWKERLLFQYTRAKDWYHRQSNDAKNMFKVLLALVALYVLFGGRFGLGGFLSGSVERRRGHYGEGNAYDQYHRRQQQPYSYGSSSYQYGSSSYGRRTPPSDDDYGYRYHHPRTSFQFPDLFDGSLLSILALAVFGYLCHRNGISPFQAIWLLNIVTAGGRRRHRRGFRRGWY